MTSVVIPLGVTKIGQEAFQGCSKLTSVVIPQSVEHITSDAFNGCGDFGDFNPLKVPTQLSLRK